MFLTKVELSNVVRKQYRYKLKSYLGVFTSLIAIQLLAMVFSSGGVSTYYSDVNGFSIEINKVSGNLILSFTMLWAFITAIMITTRAYRYDDFAFVTNRLSSNLSNILFLLSASFIGGTLAILSSFLLKVILFIFYDGQLLISHVITPVQILIGIIGASCYLFAISAIGYLVGTIVQLNKIFAVLIPVLFFGSFFYVGTRWNVTLVVSLKESIVDETFLLIFALKIVVISGLLFLAATTISNRLEVRK